MRTAPDATGQKMAGQKTLSRPRCSRMDAYQASSPPAVFESDQRGYAAGQASNLLGIPNPLGMGRIVQYQADSAGRFGHSIQKGHGLVLGYGKPVGQDDLDRAGRRAKRPAAIVPEISARTCG